MTCFDTLNPPQNLQEDPAARSAGGPSPDSLILDRPQGSTEHSKRINISHNERTGSVIGGAALIGLGLVRGRLSGLALAGLGALVLKRGLQGHCDVYEKFGINTAAGERTDPSEFYNHGVKINEVVTVNKPAQELYDYWHDYSNMPRFMHHIERVDVEGNGRSHWVMKAAGGIKVEYDAETINDEPGRLLAWRSIGGADVEHTGSVRFVDAPGGKGTEVHVNMEYLPPAGFVGRFGAKVLRLLGQAPENDVRQSLRNFKSLMETGEIASSEGPRGTCR